MVIIEYNWIVYEVNGKSIYDEKYARFVRSVCGAYRCGRLSEDVVIKGLVPIDGNYSGDCVWFDIPTLRSVPKMECQMCGLIAMRCPPQQMLALTNLQMPCINFKNRVKIETSG